MNATADDDHFIVAYPQGDIASGSGYDWNIPGVPLFGGAKVKAGAANDVGFAVSLVHVLETRYCIQSKRVYATGFSGGARLVSQLACDDSGVFAAVAPVSGLRRPTPCPTTRPVPIVSFHGEADPIDPFGGHGQAYWTYSVPVAARDWAMKDGCRPVPSVSHLPGGVTLTRYSGCEKKVTVELYAIGSEGHEWPGGPPMPAALTRLLGPQSTAVNADQLMWSFFSRYQLAK
jgi:polyhydroxybutyrate depolymerase